MLFGASSIIREIGFTTTTSIRREHKSSRASLDIINLSRGHTMESIGSACARCGSGIMSEIDI